MNDNPYFTLGPKVDPSQFVPTPLEPNELFRGDYWSIYLEDGVYVLGFMSGELAGRFKRVTISRENAEALMKGEVSCESLLRKLGAG